MVETNKLNSGTGKRTRYTKSTRHYITSQLKETGKTVIAVAYKIELGEETEYLFYNCHIEKRKGSYSAKLKARDEDDVEPDLIYGAPERATTGDIVDLHTELYYTAERHDVLDELTKENRAKSILMAVPIEVDTENSRAYIVYAYLGPDKHFITEQMEPIIVNQSLNSWLDALPFPYDMTTEHNIERRFNCTLKPRYRANKALPTYLSEELAKKLYKEKEDSLLFGDENYISHIDNILEKAAWGVVVQLDNGYITKVPTDIKPRFEILDLTEGVSCTLRDQPAPILDLKEYSVDTRINGNQLTYVIVNSLSQIERDHKELGLTPYDAWTHLELCTVSDKDRLTFFMKANEFAKISKFSKGEFISYFIKVEQPSKLIFDYSDFKENSKTVLTAISNVKQCFNKLMLYENLLLPGRKAKEKWDKGIIVIEILLVIDPPKGLSDIEEVVCKTYDTITLQFIKQMQPSWVMLGGATLQKQNFYTGEVAYSRNIEAEAGLMSCTFPTHFVEELGLRLEAFKKILEVQDTI